ncbi:MAG: hypothetical protein K0U98_10385 [Deltaproteobacteria bacterium]|nr:hypothetical protein [Deltaproteobacteria bacterium]
MILTAVNTEPLSLDRLAAKIRKSSNFRFVWQWYHREAGASPTAPPSATPAPTATEARRVLSAAIADPGCRKVLRSTFDSMYDSVFSIESLHEHCRLERRDEEFQNTMAKAAADRLGAYSRKRSDASPKERRRIDALFGSVGEYHAFEFLPGSIPGCEVCSERENYLFTNWFFGVAWDWCFVVLWKDSDLAWVGFLTDTD